MRGAGPITAAGVRWPRSPSSTTLRHPEVAPQVSEAHFPTVETSLEHLDLANIIRMSQAVAGELLLDRLIETLMTSAELRMILLHEGCGLRKERERPAL